MDIIELREFCLSLPLATEDTPFDETTLCFRLNNKMFAITDIEQKPCFVNLKCDPERAIALREQYASIVPGYHCNKKHWNTVALDGATDDKLAKELIIHSYSLIFNSLKAKDKKELIEQSPEISKIIS